MNINTIYQGDCLDILKNFSNNSIDCCITSPPYNLDIKYETYNDNITYNEYLQFTKEYFSLIYKVLKSDGRFCINIPIESNNNGERQNTFAEIYNIAKLVGFKYNSTILWNKNNASKRTAWGSWMSASSPFIIQPYEAILILYKNQWKKNIKGESTITRDEFLQYSLGYWTVSGEKKSKIGHPAPYPIELIDRLLKYFTFKNEIVLDPFIGSGTTAIACLKTNRKFIGIELNPDYIEIANKRIEPYLKQEKLM